MDTTWQTSRALFRSSSLDSKVSGALHTRDEENKKETDVLVYVHAVSLYWEKQENQETKDKKEHRGDQDELDLPDRWVYFLLLQQRQMEHPVCQSWREMFDHKHQSLQ